MKKAVEMSFNWIFALVAGGMILFLSIYGASKFIDTSERTLTTETAASLISLFDPMGTGLASGEASEISFKKKSKLFFDCEENREPPFGMQTISFQEQTFREKYGEKSERVMIKNHYIFSENELEGKKMYYFSMPFFTGFKVVDLMVIYSGDSNYCVYNVGGGHEFFEDVNGLNLQKIQFPNFSEKCEGVKICFINPKFKGGNCDIKVYEKDHYLLKEGKKLYYSEDLLFPAIFSSPDIYECNIKRIKKRFNELGKIYLNKTDIIRRENCEPTLNPELSYAIGKKVDSSKDFLMFLDDVEKFDSINKRAKDGCKLYYNVNWKK